MIIGGPGSGKSSLARKLGDITGLPVIHIDRIYWKPNWEMRSRDIIGSMTIDAAKADQWVFEGNHSETMDFRLSRADTLIFLDIGTIRRLWRVIKRSWVHRGRSRPDMAEGCPERLDWGFLKWTEGYRRNGRIKALKFIAQAPKRVDVYHLTSARMVRAFVNKTVTDCARIAKAN